MKDSMWWRIKLLAHNGFSYKLIMRRARCTKSDVSRVLRKEKIRLRDYRDGDTKDSRGLIRKLFDGKVNI